MDVHQIQGYEVLENGKPAVISDSTIWNQYFYTDFNDALEYAKSWLGSWFRYLPEDWQGESYNYSGHGDTIEVRFVPGIEV